MLETLEKERKKKRTGKSGRKGKEKVRHLAGVKEGKHSGEGVTDGAEQGDGFQRETSGEKGKLRESPPERRLPEETAAYIRGAAVSFFRKPPKASPHTLVTDKSPIERVGRLPSRPTQCKRKALRCRRITWRLVLPPQALFAPPSSLPAAREEGEGEGGPEGVCGSASGQA